MSEVCPECSQPTMVTTCVNPFCESWHREEHLTTVVVSTRHPEHYELINHADGTRWIIRDGMWQAPTREDMINLRSVGGIYDPNSPTGWPREWTPNLNTEDEV